MEKGKVTLHDDIVKLPKVGDAVKTRLNSIGIFSVSDLITYFPRDIEDRSDARQIRDLENGETATFIAKVITKPMNIKAGRYLLTKTRVSDDTGIVELVWFNQPYMRNALKEGEEYYFSGKIKQEFALKQMSSPIYEKVDLSTHVMTGTVVPKYRLTSKLNLKALKGYIKTAISEVKDELKEDFIPKEILKKYNLASYDFAIKNIHFPSDEDAYDKAKFRLKFEEFYITQLALTLLKNKVEVKKNGIKFDDVDVSDVINLLPFELTNAQLRVMEEIKKDMASHKVMNRLVQGDVGSGKTVCALLSMIIAKNNGYQSALMAPTEILAHQHYDFYKSFASKLGFKVELLVGSIKQKDKKEIYEKLSNGEIDMIIGTHALLEEGVEFKNLGLVICDEQHRFGVEQRGILTAKGEDPDVLVMTATPIPRTLGLILYGDLDISIIDEMPKGRQKIDTLVVNSSYYERMYSFVRDEIKNGRQAYIICPMVEDSEKEGMSELASVTSYTEMLKEKYLQNESVEFIHGKMKAKEKNDIMDRFNKGEIDVLVSTTVIEVGINNPNASIMIIENAERFGLSQLHQLRGRVGRGEYKSYCILISDSKTDVSKKRLDTLKKTNDGFKIAEEDLKLRGPGDFFGTKQHGIPEFKIANLYEDTAILKDAQNAVCETLDKDFLLDDKTNEKLKEKTIDVLRYNTL
ncbi:MAG: ATP-dependent DNA helicase RecG [Clostridia bacterium]|nr:ATP-dependent DNA helicase RecG [Clostridia bacterium]